MHLHQTNLKGHHYREMACFDEIDMCGAGIFFYGVHEASPKLELSADGYLGLGLAGCYDFHTNSHTSKFNLLMQMARKGMILKKKFGVYTAPISQRSASNIEQESRPSQIRFGGFNKELTDPMSVQQIWMKTVDKKTWDLPLIAIDLDFVDLKVLSTTALLNPGFPFIVAP